GGSVVTRCRGRWSTKDEYETCSIPPIGSKRCDACRIAFAAHRLERIARLQMHWAGACDVPSAPDANGDFLDRGPTFPPHPPPPPSVSTPAVSAGVAPAVNGASSSCTDCGIPLEIAGRARCNDCFAARHGRDLGGEG